MLVELTNELIQSIGIENILKLVPEHERLSCNDGKLIGNEYSGNFGLPRCTRCCLQYYQQNGQFPTRSLTDKVYIEISIRFYSNSAEQPI